MFEYQASFQPDCEPNCGTCGASVGAVLSFDVTTPDLMTVHVYICDACLLKMLDAIPATLVPPEHGMTMRDILRLSDLASAG